DEDGVPRLAGVKGGKLVVVDLRALTAALSLPGAVDLDFRIDDLVVADDNAGGVDGHKERVVAPGHGPLEIDLVVLEVHRLGGAQHERLAIVGGAGARITDRLQAAAV